MTPTKLPIVMLVDDELSILEALERDLQHRFECIKCQSFHQAQEILRSNSEIRVLLTDEVLGPGFSGLDLLHWAQETTPLVVRCLISGQLDSDKITAALGKGLYHRFFYKPWDSKVLQFQLKECLVMGDLLKESKLDPLTSLLNRRGFDEQILIEIERANRHQRKLSLVLWDIDDFKLINDNQGHSAGDDKLIIFAEHLKACLRNIDYVARLGGDEFALILPDTGRDEAAFVAERILRSVRGGLSVSGGVVELNLGSDTAVTLLLRADESLYLAKRKGKNQVQVQN